MELRFVETADVSHTLFVPALNEHYHSVHGAIREADHVFLKNGVGHFPDKPLLKILEVGLGTGLNALLTFLHAQQSGKRIIYHSIEANPLPMNFHLQLNYCNLIGDSSARTLFNRIHEIPWNCQVTLSPHFTLKKIKATLQNSVLADDYDLVYFDAFAPEKQPELWETPVFELLIGHMLKGAALVTYCAQGQAKRNMKEAGFKVEALPGPPGKREMTRAIKP